MQQIRRAYRLKALQTHPDKGTDADADGWTDTCGDCDDEDPDYALSIDNEKWEDEYPFQRSTKFTLMRKMDMTI